MFRVAEYQWVSDVVWSAERRFDTAVLAEVMGATVGFFAPDYGIGVAQQQQQQQQQHNVLFSSCEAAAATAVFSCSEMQWQAVPNAREYAVEVLSRSPNSSVAMSLASILVRDSSVGLNIALLNLSSAAASSSSSLHPLLSITPQSHNATASPLYLAFRPHTPNVSRVAIDWSLLLLSFDSPLLCDIHVYVPRPFLAPQRIATLQTGRRLFVLRMKGHDGFSTPCASAGRCGKLRIQLSICYATSAEPQADFARVPLRSVSLPWLPSYVVDTVSNITREISLAGDGSITVNAEAFEGIGGEGGEGGDVATRCEIHSTVKMISQTSSSSNSSSSSSSSSGTIRPHLFVSTITSATATLCIVINTTCVVPSSCTIVIAAAAAPQNTSEF